MEISIKKFFFHFTAIFLLAIFACTISVPAFAESNDDFLNKDCSAYASPEGFVKKSVLSCLQARNTSSCEKKAAQYFETCGYSGNYKKLSAKYNSELLMIMVLHSTPSLKGPGQIDSKL